MYLPHKSSKYVILKWIDSFFTLNEEHFTFHLPYKQSGMFANRKYEEFSYPQKSKMCNPILVALLKVWPHYSQPSRENSSGASPLVSYKEVVHPRLIKFDL